MAALTFDDLPDAPTQDPGISFDDLPDVGGKAEGPTFDDLPVASKAEEVPQMRATPTFAGELMAGRIAPAASLAYEAARRPFSGLIGPTEKERSEGMIPWGHEADGSVHYEYKPLGDRMAREQGLMTPFVPVPHLEPNPEDGIAKAIGKGVFNTGAGLVGAVSSPLGALLPGAGEVPLLARTAAGLFAGDIMANVPAQIKQAFTGKTLQEKVEGGLGTIASGLMATGAGIHAIAPFERASISASESPLAIDAKEPTPATPVPPAEPAPAPPTVESHVLKVTAEVVEGDGAPKTAEALREKAAEVEKAAAPEPAPTDAPPVVETVEEKHRPEVDLLNGLRGHQDVTEAAPVERQAELPISGKSRAPVPELTPAVSEPVQVVEPATESQVQGLTPVPIPLADLKLSQDIPQFKKGADAKGVVQPLEGKFDRTGTAPIQVWRRLNGDLEIISGRHRFDLAQRSGEETILSQVHDEAAGFDARAAARLDAELNIRDEHGSTSDYASYFRHSDLSEEDASARGLLGRAKGRAGLTIARGASEDVFALHQSGRLTDAEAETISQAAPGNDAAQRVGTRAIFDGESISDARGAIEAALADAAEQGSQQGDFFSDTSLDERWRAQGKVASQQQREIRSQISSVEGAARNPEVARKFGVDVNDPEGIKKRLTELRAELGRWQNWFRHPDLAAIVRGEVAPKAETAKPAPSKPKSVVPSDTTGDLLKGKADDPFNLVAETSADKAKREKAETADTEAKAAADAAEAKRIADANQGDLFSKAPQTPENRLVKTLRDAAATAPTEADLEAAGKAPEVLEYPRPGGAGKIIVQNTREALLRVADRYLPRGEEKHAEIQGLADQFSKDTGLKVNVWKNQSELPAAVRSRLQGGDVHEGLLDPTTNEIHIFTDNLKSGERAGEVLLHEGKGHYGVMSILPYDHPAWQGIADTVMRTAPTKTLVEIVNSYIGKKPGEWTPADRAKIASEYAARLAERPEANPPAWEAIKQAVRNALRALGFVKEWSEKDIRYLVRRGGKAVDEGRGRKTDQTGDIRASVRDLSKEVQDETPYSRHIEDAFEAAVPDEASRKQIDAWVVAKLGGGELPSLTPNERSVAEKFVSYFRQKGDFAQRNGVKGAAQDAFEAELAKSPNLTLAERLAVYSAAVNKLATERATQRTAGLPGTGEKSPTSTKNAVVDQERAKRGLPPAMEPAQREFGVVWDEAMRQVDQAGPDSNPGKELVNALEDKARPISDTENALLLHRQITLQNAFDAAAVEARKAAEAGDTARGETLRIETARLSDELLQIYNVGKKVGTELGRGLNIRKMMAAEDYTLAKMEVRKRAANGGKALTTEQAAEMKGQYQQIELLSKAADEAVSHAEETAAGHAATDAMKETVEKVKPTRAPRKAKPAPAEVPPTSEKTKGWLQKQADAARERIKSRGGRLMAGIDPLDVADRVIVAAADIAGGLRDFAGWASAKLREWGAEYEPHLRDIWDRANAMIAQHEKVAAISQKAAGRIKDGASLKDIRPYVQRMAEALVRDGGVTELEPLLDALHPLVEEVLPGTTRRQTMDVFSGYGEFRPLSKDAIKVQLRDLRGQAQQLGKIGDMQAGEAPKKTGPERRSPSDKERAHIKEVERLKREGNYKVTDPESQLRSALQAIKTRLRNQISDLTTYLDTGEHRPGRTPVEHDAEAQDLSSLRDFLKATIEEIEGKPGMTEEQRIEATKKALQRSIDEYGRRMQEGDFAPKKGKPQPSSPEIEKMRAERDAIRAVFQELREVDEGVKRQRAAKRETDLQEQIAELDRRLQAGDIAKAPERAGEPTQRAEDLVSERDALMRQLVEERRKALPALTDAEKEAAIQRRALAAYKTRTANRIAELQSALARGDFAPKVRRVLKMDDAALKAKAELQRAKNDYERGLIADRLSKRGTMERALDGASKWRRAWVLSGVHSILRLGSSASEIIAITPVEEAIGAGLGKLPVLGRVLERGRHQPSMEAEVAAISANISHLFSDIGDYLKKGGTNLDEVFGQAHLYPFEFKEFIGRIHGALKTPARRNEWTRRYTQELRYEEKQGFDPSNPMIQMRAGVNAYKAAQASIFLEDNMVVDAYKRALSRFTQPDKTTGKPSMGGKLAETALRVTLPIVRIPTNIVARTFEYTFGTVTGSFRLARALRRGVDNLPPEQADLIRQNLARGSLGAAMVVLGILNPGSIGGYYTGKRDESDVHEGSIKKPKWAQNLAPSWVPILGGTDLPKYLVHHPLLECLQIGATIRRIAESKIKGETQGYLAGAVTAFLGLTKEVPFLDAIEHTADAIRNRDSLRTYGEKMAESILVPQLVREAANFSDRDAKGNTIKRKPEGFLQTIETGIPGLRQRVKKR